MVMKTIGDFDFKGKTVLLRADINSDVKKGVAIMNERIRSTKKVVRELCKKNAKVIILAHQSRPGKEDFIHLKSHAKLLKVKFVPDIIGGIAAHEISFLKPGNAILLDNVRFLKEESEPGRNNLVNFFQGCVDIYVNDAFSVCHRKQTSIVSFPKYFPSCMGRTLQREVEALKKVNVKKCLYVLGGGKPEDNIKLLGKGNRVIASGFFGQMIMLANGFDFGYHEDFLKEFLGKEFGVKSKLRGLDKKVILPTDFAVNAQGKRKECKVDDFPGVYRIDDIGVQSIRNFKREIVRAPAIYMKGPLGDCREKQFCKGTFEVLKAISKSKGFSLIGGGHLNDAIDKSGISRKRFDHISLSGGALLRYLAGEKLPGLEALEKCKE